MVDTAHDLTEISERLAKLAAETGDDRFAEAVAALRRVREREERRNEKRHLHDLIFDLAELCAADVKSVREKAKHLEELAIEYDRDGWQKHRHRVTAPPYLSDADELLRRIFDQAGAMPSRESLRKILTGRYY